MRRDTVFVRKVERATVEYELGKYGGYGVALEYGTGGLDSGYSVEQLWKESAPRLLCSSADHQDMLQRVHMYMVTTTE